MRGRLRGADGLSRGLIRALRSPPAVPSAGGGWPPVVVSGVAGRARAVRTVRSMRPITAADALPARSSMLAPLVLKALSPLPSATARVPMPPSIVVASVVADAGVPVAAR
eukprot:CAMPEP_0205920704 /NCGR_PEP_ID=MMETSP1325-20131115/11625_1 /ASSEMBLY_ACC=CAM_ASM_000708 /TAXON_ID=236786 /ORGANISM="Florenciella sp., Strain RCC1007" /LENGTH=109 /DNA_ID=CAMNT_0053288423 /DNA_START=36 /DNA_END=365 /DNA_ORIENTATION=-